MADKTELQMVKDKESEEHELIKRMKADEDLRNLKKYKMRNLDNTGAMDKVANVTLPLPALVIAKTIAKLIQVQRQPQVIADELSDKATTQIEEFIEDEEYEIDTLLNLRGEVPAFNFNSDISCSRGRIAEQIVTRMKDGEYIPDVRQLDTLFFRYQMGPNGMLWGAPTTWRPREWLEDEYPEELFKIGFTGLTRTGSEGGTKLYKVTDIWTKKTKNKPAQNIVYLEDKEIKRSLSKDVLGYDIDYPPFNVQIVPTGSVLKGTGSLKHSGESVYETLRHIFPERNFVATTLKTLNYNLFRPPTQFPTEEGLTATPPEKNPSTPGEVTMTERGAPITPVFTPDIRAYTTLYDDTTKEIMEMAGYSSMDFGQLAWPLSDRALGRLAQGKLELLAPRLQALALLYQARYKMIIKQFLAIGESIKLGELGHRREYSPETLKGEYTIKFRYFSISKTEMGLDANIANSMGDDVSEDYKRREIYKLPDPDGEKTKLYEEQAENMHPTILLYNQGHSMIDAKRDIEARLILKRLIGLLKSGETQEPQIPERKVKRPLAEETGRAPVS